MKTRKLLLCAVSITAALVASRAYSQSIPTTYNLVTPGFGVNGTVNDGGLILDYPSGVMSFSSTSFDAFCVEPLVDLPYGTSLVYEVTDISTLTNSNAVALVVAYYLSSGQTQEDAAAVQWAIWELTTESSGSFSLADGNVRILAGDEDTGALANTYLGLAQSNPNSLAPASLAYLTNGDQQDVVTWNLVPEPGSAALALLSAVALIGRRRRRRSS